MSGHRTWSPSPPASGERAGARGKGFTLIDAFSPPRVIAPGFTADFTVRFQPEVAGSHTAKLQINDRIYDLRAGSQPQPRVEVQSGGAWVADPQPPGRLVV